MAEPAVKSKFFLKCLLVVVFVIVFVYSSQITVYIFAVTRIYQGDSTRANIHSSFYTGRKYAIDIDKDRLNRLFAVLRSHEARFSEVLAKLGVVKFEDIIGYLNQPFQDGELLTDQEYELTRFVELSKDGKNLAVNDEFVRLLRNKSEFYSFDHPRNLVLPQSLEVGRFWNESYA